MITQNGIYGREASKFAGYIDQYGVPGNETETKTECTLALGFNLSNLDCLNLPKSSISKIIFEIMMWLLFLVGFFSVIGCAISGILYLTAAGDEDQAKKAKNTFFYSIIGTIVAISGVVAINFAFKLLSGSSLM